MTLQIAPEVRSLQYTWDVPAMMDEEECGGSLCRRDGDTNGAIILWNAYHNWEYLKWLLDVKEHYLWQTTTPVAGHWSSNIVMKLNRMICFWWRHGVRNYGSCWWGWWLSFNIVNCQMREKLIHRYICVIILLIDLDIMYIMYTYLAIVS